MPTAALTFIRSHVSVRQAQRSANAPEIRSNANQNQAVSERNKTTIQNLDYRRTEGKE